MKLELTHWRIWDDSGPSLAAAALVFPLCRSKSLIYSTSFAPPEAARPCASPVAAAAAYNEDRLRRLELPAPPLSTTRMFELLFTSTFWLPLIPEKRAAAPPIIPGLLPGPRLTALEDRRWSDWRVNSLRFDVLTPPLLIYAITCVMIYPYCVFSSRTRSNYLVTSSSCYFVSTCFYRLRSIFSASSSFSRFNAAFSDAICR